MSSIIYGDGNAISTMYRLIVVHSVYSNRLPRWLTSLGKSDLLHHHDIFQGLRMGKLLPPVGGMYQKLQVYLHPVLG